MIRKIKMSVFFALLLQSILINGQNEINKVYIDYTENKFVNSISDTLNTYIIFEEGFTMDSIYVYIKDTLFEAKIVITNEIVGVAGQIIIPSNINEKYFLLKINNSQKIPVFFYSNKHYIGIRKIKNNELLIKYSKFLPLYY
jgi:hypothetical protein